MKHPLQVKYLDFLFFLTTHENLRLSFKIDRYKVNQMVSLLDYDLLLDPNWYRGILPEPADHVAEKFNFFILNCNTVWKNFIEFPDAFRPISSIRDD